MSQFANNIRTRRNEKGLTQDELAKMLSVSRNSISNWETGKNYPDFELLIAISDTLEISLDVLIKEDYELMKHVADNERLSKKRKRLLSVTVPVLAVLVVFFFISVFHLNVTPIKKEDITSTKVENNALTMEVKLNDFESIAAWWMESDINGNVELTVEKDFNPRNYYTRHFSKKKIENIVVIPLDRNDLDTNKITLFNTGETIEF